MSQWEDVGLKKWLVQQCKGLGMSQPTPVQLNCIPAILAGTGCIGCAKTGSGKTAAFALPILDKLSDDPYGIFALVLTPTRELAFQIKDQFAALGAHVSARTCVVVGGMDMLTQTLELARKPHVVIATPGRLADHISSGDGLNLSRTKFLVMDEADRLFEDCFAADLGTIFPTLPTARQTLLFTATLSDTITQISQSGSSKPFLYKCEEDVATVGTLQQDYVLVPEMMRNCALAHTIRALAPEDTCMIFTHSCKSAQIITIGLKKLGFPCTALHSELKQHARLSSLAKFRSKAVNILVATDVASRGLDIPFVACVVNYNTPSSPVDYIHRVGRTARAGTAGRAVTIVTQHDVTRLQAIEKHIGVKLEETKINDEESVKIMQNVSLAMREAVLHLDTHGFGETRARNRAKHEKAEGKDNSDHGSKKSKDNTDPGDKRKRVKTDISSNEKLKTVKDLNIVSKNNNLKSKTSEQSVNSSSGLVRKKKRKVPKNVEV